jgi:hypothetical protein
MAGVRTRAPEKIYREQQRAEGRFVGVVYLAQQRPSSSILRFASRWTSERRAERGIGDYKFTM